MRAELYREAHAPGGDLEPVADAEARAVWDALKRDAAALGAELELAPEPPALEDLGLEL